MWRMMIRYAIAMGARDIDIGNASGIANAEERTSGAARDRGIVIATITFCTPVPKIETTRAP